MEHDVRKNGISGSTLKIIAMVSMLIDHIGASVLERKIVSNPSLFDAVGHIKMEPIVIVYYSMRCIGRLAFPIFIYLIVEGIGYTRNKWKYCGRMILFAFLSEVPFDMAFQLSVDDVKTGKIVEFEYQNVFFTLAIGVLLLTMVDRIHKIDFGENTKFFQFVTELFLAVSLSAFAEFLHTDYGAVGVLAIYGAYKVKNRTVLQGQTGKQKKEMVSVMSFVLLFSSVLELFVLFDIVPIYLYNGERGLKWKWVFYLFYPVHLLLLAGVCILLGV